MCVVGMYVYIRHVLHITQFSTNFNNEETKVQESVVACPASRCMVVAQMGFEISSV